MWPYPWTHVGTPSHLGHMDRVAATMPSQAHAGAAQEAPDIGQWEGQDVPLVRPSSCNVKGGIPSSRRYLPTYLLPGHLAKTDLGKKHQCVALTTPRGWRVQSTTAKNNPIPGIQCHPILIHSVLALWPCNTCHCVGTGSLVGNTSPASSTQNSPPEKSPTVTMALKGKWSWCLCPGIVLEGEIPWFTWTAVQVNHDGNRARP